MVVDGVVVEKPHALVDDGGTVCFFSMAENGEAADDAPKPNFSAAAEAA